MPSSSARIDALTVERETWAAERAAPTVERDEYRKLYLQTLELCRKLELGIVGPKRERLSPGDAQLTMSLLQILLGGGGGGGGGDLGTGRATRARRGDQGPGPHPR